MKIHVTVRKQLRALAPLKYPVAARQITVWSHLNDGAYYCYCAYVLCIARYSGFLWVVPTNTGIFLRGLTKCRWYLKRKLGVTMHFAEKIKRQFRKKSHTLPYISALFRDIVAYLSLKNTWLPPIFLLDSNSPC